MDDIDDIDDISYTDDATAAPVTPTKRCSVCNCWLRAGNESDTCAACAVAGSNKSSCIRCLARNRANAADGIDPETGRVRERVAGAADMLCRECHELVGHRYTADAVRRETRAIGSASVESCAVCGEERSYPAGHMAAAHMDRMRRNYPEGTTVLAALHADCYVCSGCAGIAQLAVKKLLVSAARRRAKAKKNVR